MDTIDRFLDEEGRLKQWPAKQKFKALALQYMAEKFEPEHIYTEHEVNAILASWHSFSDLFILRRGLIEAGLLQRKPDGSAYWRPASEPSADGAETGVSEPR